MSEKQYRSNILRCKVCICKLFPIHVRILLLICSLQSDRRVRRARVRARRSTRLSRPSLDLPELSCQGNKCVSAAYNGGQNNSIAIARPDSNTNNNCDDNTDDDTSSNVETDTESETGNNSDNNNNNNSENAVDPNGTFMENVQSLSAQ